VTLRTAGAFVERIEMSTFQRILAQIADPNLALLFLSIGTLAVVYEAANPGMGFAGIAGVIMILLGFFALSVLPVATAGIALLILAMALFIGEIFVPGIGVFAAGGTISLILAGIFLFDGPLGVSMPLLWPSAMVLGLASAYAGREAFKARFAPSTTGAGTLVGQEVTVVGDAKAGWSAFLGGTWWTVRPAEGNLQDGDVAQVTAVDGIRLVVNPKEQSHEL
jgi:membrane-bound serine protease (ClpP class)